MGFTFIVETSKRQGKIESNFDRTYTRTFVIGTDNPLMGPGDVVLHPDLPLRYSAHPDDIKARLLSLSPRVYADDPSMWEVEAEYGYHLNHHPPQQHTVAPADRVEAPLLRPPDYRVSSGMVERAALQAYDYEQDPPTLSVEILNTAGDPFFPPPNRKVPTTIITIAKNYAAAPTFDDHLSLRWKVNKNETWTVGPYTVLQYEGLLKDLFAEIVIEQNLRYWRWTWVVEVCSLGWAWKTLNIGKRKKVDGAKLPIAPFGQPVSQPVLLGEDGDVLGEGFTPLKKTFHLYNAVTMPNL